MDELDRFTNAVMRNPEKDVLAVYNALEKQSKRPFEEALMFVDTASEITRSEFAAYYSPESQP